MQGLKTQNVEALRATIAALENRPLLADSPAWFGSNSLGMPIAPPGSLHEVFTDQQSNGTASLGYALALSHGLLSTRKSAILVMQLARDRQALGVPYAAGFNGFGIDPDDIVLCLLETPVALLWALEEAIGCKAVAAVIADVGPGVKELDFTASRRLSLRAAAGGSSVFLLRAGTGREVSAAHFRWRLNPELSQGRPFDPRAPDLPRWRVELEKGRLGPKRYPMEWMLDWTKDGFVLVKPETGRAAANAAGAPLSGAASAAMGNRLSQAS